MKTQRIKRKLKQLWHQSSKYQHLLRQEAGCAYVSDTPDKTEEDDLIQYYNENHKKLSDGTYGQRFL